MNGCCEGATGKCEIPMVRVMKGRCGEGDFDLRAMRLDGGARCAEGRSFGRRFTSRAEKVEGLEVYLKDLEAEAEAVREAIADMKQA